MKNNIIALILSASVLVVSCDLAEQPKAKAGRDMIFGSETGLLTYTNGFYEYLPDYDNAHKQNITMDNAAKNATGTYEVGAYTTNTSTSWSWGSIRNVNYFLKYNTSSNVSRSATTSAVSPDSSEPTCISTSSCSTGQFLGSTFLWSRTALNSTRPRTAVT